MIPTYKTITTWDVKLKDTVNLEGVDAARVAWLEAAVDADKTNVVQGGQVNDYTSNRLWVDEASANEWKDFIIALGAQHGKTVTVDVEAYTPEE